MKCIEIMKNNNKYKKNQMKLDKKKEDVKCY